MDELRRIDRGAAWTLLGNLLNIAPALLELVLLRKFGLEAWGEFLAAQAIVLVGGRITCLGLDKSMLWHLPNLAKEGRGIRRPAWGAALIAAGFGAVMGLALSGPLLHLALPRQSIPGLAHFVILATPFFSASEVFIGALQGIQKFQYRPLLRDLGASAFFAPIAIAFSFVPGIGAASLGIGFLAGHVLISILSAWFWSRESRDSRHGPLIPTMALVRYSIPIWLADSTNSAGLRAAVLLLSRVAAPGVVGAFGVIQSLWQSATLARRAFETPLVTLTASSPDTAEVAHLYGKVVQRVLLWQIPVVFLASTAGGSILHLISPQLGSPSEHLGLAWLVTCSFLASGPAMGQQVLAGLGHSSRIFFNNVFGTLATILFLWLLAPRLGLIGACLAQGGAILATAALGAWQIREFADLPPFPGRYAMALCATLLPAAVGAEMYIHFAFPWPAWALGAILILVWTATVPGRLKE